MEKDFYKLLMQFAALPEPEPELGFFDIAGFPHYESVCSNILAFYLQPDHEHKLGDLVLFSFLKLLGKHYSPQKVVVRREYPTLGGGRLDVIVEAETFVLGIENKIYHSLENDLDDYSETLKNLSSNDREIYGVVLTIKPSVIPRNSGFINITYVDLWREVKANSGFYITKSYNKWLVFLLDFIKATEVLGGPGMEITPRDQFMIDNDELIVKLFTEYSKFLEKLKKRLFIIKDLLDVENLSLKCLEKQWIYASECLVHDFNFSGNKISFDLYISPSGWELQIFARNVKSSNYLRRLIQPRMINLEFNNNKYVIRHWPLTTDLEEIRNTLVEWLSWVEARSTELREESES